MKIKYPIVMGILGAVIAFQPIQGSESVPSAFGSGFDVQKFYKPFTSKEITSENQQTWPYYKSVSSHWDTYAAHGTSKIKHSNNPAKLTVAKNDKSFNLNTEFKDGKSFIQSFQDTQVKGFIVMKDNNIISEFYDNGFMTEDTNLLQSASKTFAGVITGQLVDKGLLDPNNKVEKYLKDFKGTSVGKATVQQVLDMTSGIPQLLDFHTPGAEGYNFEIEQGLKKGKTIGHRNAIKSSQGIAKPGKEWNYNDKNTDILALLAEKVTGKKYPQLLSELFDSFGANYDGSIAKTSDGTSSPSYGISITARDYALFHQWIAQGKGPESYYKSAMDTSKIEFGQNETGKLLGTDITYGSQTYYLKDQAILYSSGSFGQVGFSDMKTGTSIIFLQDWAVNAELDKFKKTRERAFKILEYIRSNNM